MKLTGLAAHLACQVLRKKFQMLNAKECSDNAEKCMKLAAEATDPILKQRLSETAQGWNRLAIDLAKLEEKLAQEQPAA
jgi:hypothetical protein